MFLEKGALLSILSNSKFLGKCAMNIRRVYIACIAAFACLASACGGSNDDEEVLTYEVAAYRSPCTGSFATMCLNIRQPGEASYQFFYDPIAGFTPQWGRAYTIEVGKSNVSNPPADASNATFRLRRVITESPVAAGTQFTVTTIPLRQFVLLAAPNAGTIGGTPFTCAAAQTCADLQALLAGDPALKLTFGYSASATALPLVLQSAVLN
jgi:hypothetical protein